MQPPPDTQVESPPVAGCPGQKPLTRHESFSAAWPLTIQVPERVKAGNEELNNAQSD